MCICTTLYNTLYSEDTLYRNLKRLSCGDILILLAYYLQIRNIIAFLQFLTLSNLKINCSLFSDGKQALINELHRYYRLKKSKYGSCNVNSILYLCINSQRQGWISYLHLKSASNFRCYSFPSRHLCMYKYKLCICNLVGNTRFSQTIAVFHNLMYEYLL